MSNILLDGCFTILSSWAIFDSAIRYRKQCRRVPASTIYQYRPWHYYGALLGLVLWGLDIGTIYLPPSWTFTFKLLGLILTAIGWFLVFYARIVLRDSWTPHIRIVPNSEWKTSGPYRFIRHPIYVGEATLFLGAALYLRSASVFMLLFVVGSLYNVHRARLEMRIRRA